ncbi:MAG TPA: SDR family oxidoreductase [Beijerinckiaceae bacterium]|nr:SDR family oxidoreductase [Beijerinckiaceae bacterium]
MNPFDLSGRHVLLTGGGSGLGLAVAEGLAAAGARLSLVGRDESKLQGAADKIVKAGGNAAPFRCDVTDRDALPALVEKAERAGGPIDVLFNNAGVQQRAPVLAFPADGWDRMIATHLSAPFFLSQAVARGMVERRRGKIINTLSLMSELGRPTIVPYTAAKGGLKMLTRGLATELGPHNIQVNGIAPGYFRTEMNEALMADPDFDGWVRNRTPARRWGEPHELVGAAILLASSASDFINGQVLFVDGGLTASV